MDIYNSDLLVELYDVSYSKGVNLRQVSDISLALPQIPNLGYQIIVPTKQPLPDEKRIVITPDELKQHTYLDKIEVKERFGIRIIDLRNRDELRALMKDNEAIISQITRSKIELAAFIRAHFPIDKIID